MSDIAPDGRTPLGLIGLGAFGQLAARHLAPHFTVRAYDPAPDAAMRAAALGVESVDLAKAAGCPVVVLAMPVQALEDVCRQIAPLLADGALVLDVCSVKVRPMQTMRTLLPPRVRVVGTHPLFGPESGREGVAGLQIVLCRDPDHGGPADVACVRDFLSGRLGLQVFEATPEEHDRTMAVVQGLTHLVAKVLSRMNAANQPFTTLSFDLMMQSADMLRNDSDQLFRAIEQMNPYAGDVRRSFFDAARRLDESL